MRMKEREREGEMCEKIAMARTEKLKMTKICPLSHCHRQTEKAIGNLSI